MSPNDKSYSVSTSGFKTVQAIAGTSGSDTAWL